MARITPRITPFVPKPQYYTPKHLIRGGVRSIATGNVPHPRITIPKIPVSGVSTQAPKIKNLLTATHTGRPPSSNPQAAVKPKSTTGISSRPPRTMRLQTSAKAQQPGIHSIQGFKVKARQSNPFKISTPHPFRIKVGKVI